MAQVKIFGLAHSLNPIKKKLSDSIHSCIVEALNFPHEKRFHRFFPMQPEDFSFPDDRSEQYILIEISMMEGRTVETKKRLIRLLFERVGAELGIAFADIEITIYESPKCNWGFRGQTGDEIALNYKVEI